MYKWRQERDIRAEIKKKRQRHPQDERCNGNGTKQVVECSVCSAGYAEIAQVRYRQVLD